MNTHMKSCYIICTAGLGSPCHQYWPAKMGKGFPIHAVSTCSHMCMACLDVCDLFHVSKTPKYTKSRALVNTVYCVCMCLCLSVHLSTHPLMNMSPFLLSLHGLNMTVPFRLDRHSHYNKPALYWGQIDFGQSLVY